MCRTTTRTAHTLSAALVRHGLNMTDPNAILEQETDPAGLFLSMMIAIVVIMQLCTNIAPALVKPVLLDGTLISNGRYVMTYSGYDTVGADDVPSVVGIGSSILMMAMDGGCMNEMTTVDEARYYNFAIDGAYPYTEMVQVPALIRAHPDVVIIEIGPNSLWGWTGDPWPGMLEYNEFRFQLASLYLEERDYQDWYDILEPRDQAHFDSDVLDRSEAWSEYTLEAIELHLSRQIDELARPDVAAYTYVPPVGSEAWNEYLGTPNWRASKIQDWNDTEVREYLDESMAKKKGQGVYNPRAEGTQNHAALEYTIESLTAAGIEVLIVSIPHHPWVREYLDPGQMDGLNETYARYGAMGGVQTLEMHWELWPEEAFSDRNHLDADGREVFCQRVTPVVDAMLK